MDGKHSTPGQIIKKVFGEALAIFRVAGSDSLLAKVALWNPLTWGITVGVGAARGVKLSFEQKKTAPGNHVPETV